MLWASFGKLRIVEDRHGGKREVGEWALHVQESPWRIVRDKALFIGSTDMHRDRDTGDWLDDEPAIGGCRFDMLSDMLNLNLASTVHIVETITCDGLGGFNLTLNDGTQIDAFTSSSFEVPDCEFWRLFVPNSEADHFVVETHSTISDN
ncbi:MAG: hypothetical protein ABJN04_06955 [Hyphomicrobiales bacterium]